MWNERTTGFTKAEALESIKAREAVNADMPANNALSTAAATMLAGMPDGNTVITSIGDFNDDGSGVWEVLIKVSRQGGT